MKCLVYRFYVKQLHYIYKINPYILNCDIEMICFHSSLTLFKLIIKNVYINLFPTIHHLHHKIDY